MCGRFTLILDPVALREDLDLGPAPFDLLPRYNVAPTQPVAAVRDGESRTVELYRWGLIPSWAKDPSIGSRMINARSETILEKPTFKAAMTRRRCLILADGFFEWLRPGGKAGRSQPYYFKLADGKPFAFAGLWDLWTPPDGSELPTCTIITTAANERVGKIHERMPVILDAAAMWAWLDPSARPVDLLALLKPYPAEKMTDYPVSPALNSPNVDSPECILPLKKPGADETTPERLI
jgi:putative SOS response-associated peptidase YedK